MRILIIEDQEDICTALKVYLEKECYAVDTASDGEKGSYLARTNDYDLIILDNILPKKDGLEVCKEIRSNGTEIPILMLSVKTDPAVKTDLLNAGVDDYLNKPFSFNELLARIRALLRRPKQLTSEVLQVGTLSLDSKKHTVTRGTSEIYLTRKEFALLEYLMRNKGNTLSRGMLMEHVWDRNVDPFSNTVESHMLSLRKKIAHKNNKKFILTIPGRGYRIDEEVK